jgi:hypothetical protein
MRTLLVVSCLAAACGGPGGATHASHAGHAPAGFNLAYDPAIPHIVPRPLFDFLEQHQWGDYHLTFHMARRYYVAGARTRAWLDEIGVGPAPLQEGDVGSGVEFLVMHRAMIDFLRGQFGGLPLAPTTPTTARPPSAPCSTAGPTTRPCARTWSRPARTRRCSTPPPRRWPSRPGSPPRTSSDASCRPRCACSPGPATSGCTCRTARPASGSTTCCTTSSATAGRSTSANPQVNLASQLFWGLHGWVDATWRRFEATHVRSADEQRRFDELTTEYKTHMQQHGGGHRGPPDHVIRKPAPDLVSELAGKAFSTVITCADLAPGTTSPDCP